MFDEMEKKKKEYIENCPGYRLNYNFIEKATSEPLIIAILTSLMSRIHTEVYFHCLL